MKTARFVEALLRYKRAIVVLTLLITGFLGWQIQHLTINADVLSSLPDSDPDAQLMKEIGQNFGGNRMGIIIVETDNIFQANRLENLGILTDSIARIEGISSVSSLSNVINIEGGDYGIEIGKLVDPDNPPSTEADFNLIRERIKANEMYKGTLVSDDETSALVVFTLYDDSDVNLVAKEVLEKSQALQLEEKLYYIGSPMLITYIAELMRKDLSMLLPLAFLLIGLILWLSFRSWAGVLFPLLTAVIAIVWVLGTMSLLGYAMSMISNNIPIILLAVGSAYAIHVVNRIERMRQEGSAEAVKEALIYVAIPVFLAALTTAAGFLSFVFGAYLEMIRDFGVFTALGTFFACLLSIFFVPALSKNTSHTKAETPASRGALAASEGVPLLLRKLPNLLFKHPKTTLTLWVLVLLVSVAGTVLIKRSVDIQEYFKKDNPTRMAEQIMVEKFGGTKPVFVQFKGDVQSPEVLQKMMNTSRFMEQNPEVIGSMSIAKLVAELNFAITGERAIPEDPAMVQQLWFLIDGNDMLKRFVNEDLTEGIIISKFRSPEKSDKLVFAKSIRAFLEEESDEQCEIRATGMPFVDITMDDSLVNSQLGSISMAILFVILIVGLTLRSLLSGVLAALPIVSAIVLLFGIMGFAGISLNIATVLVASVALGIGIDYSIHVISHFNHKYRSSGEVEEAVKEAIHVSGRAILINVMAVSAGFLVLIFSEMVPLQYFGILIAVSMVGSSFGALTLLPAILILIHRKKKTKKLV